MVSCAKRTWQRAPALDATEAPDRPDQHQGVSTTSYQDRRIQVSYDRASSKLRTLIRRMFTNISILKVHFSAAVQNLKPDHRLREAMRNVL